MAATNLERVASRVEWVGSLDAVPLAQFLRQIASEERSGDLQINLGSAIKSIYVDHGFVIFAESNLKRDRLGESLIADGRISRHEFALASMLMKGSRDKFGQALVHVRRGARKACSGSSQSDRDVAVQVPRCGLQLRRARYRDPGGVDGELVHLPHPPRRRAAHDEREAPPGGPSPAQHDGAGRGASSFHHRSAEAEADRAKRSAQCRQRSSPLSVARARRRRTRPRASGVLRLVCGGASRACRPKRAASFEGPGRNGRLRAL